eukprot:TRINITY_DN24081_c0_g1_i3.p2 TRINITY_DN24081_c0_g1~~TRINITY_DN24081_c0_g1_i3.p2  ORF type:complete len:221 (+),score=-12.25 TRINITY_DN24081_c0_g1_i3:658-1320(+)
MYMLIRICSQQMVANYKLDSYNILYCSALEKQIIHSMLKLLCFYNLGIIFRVHNISYYGNFYLYKITFAKNIYTTMNKNFLLLTQAQSQNIFFEYMNQGRSKITKIYLPKINIYLSRLSVQATRCTFREQIRQIFLYVQAWYIYLQEHQNMLLKQMLEFDKNCISFVKCVSLVTFHSNLNFIFVEQFFLQRNQRKQNINVLIVYTTKKRSLDSKYSQFQF